MPGTPWAACPRSALKRVLAKAEREHGISFSVGFETEFILLQRPASTQQAGVPPCIDRSIYCLSSAYNDAAPGMSWHVLPVCMQQQPPCMHMQWL